MEGLQLAKKQKTTVTNAIRLITAAKLPHEILTYESDGEIGENFGERSAEKMGVDKEQSFKTLVIRGERTGISVACIPSCCEVDLKKFARAAGDKKAEMIHVKELLELTGYIRGSVSPIGMKKKYPTYISDRALKFDKILVSGGMCGIAVRMTPQDIQKITNAVFVDITV